MSKGSDLIMSGATILLAVGAFTVGSKGPVVYKDTGLNALEVVATKATTLVQDAQGSLLVGDLLAGDDSCQEGITLQGVTLVCEEDTPCQDMVLATLKGECWKAKK